ncbi:MAG: hypothetical protein IT432_00310 [Phycisphaerales bacterium]|nr:hypothetical protein [Phycisphaerales bacterium]
MSDSRHVESLVKFLGEAAAPGHAFAVLGLERLAHADTVVLRALNEQLAKVAAHPQNSTPEADEVRMILHTAAAQLMSKRRTAEHVLAAGSSGGMTNGGGPCQSQSMPRGLVAPVVLAELQVIMARHGGMSREAMSEFSALAERENVELAELMDAFASPPKAQPEPTKPSPRGLAWPADLSEPRPEEIVRPGEIPEDIDPATRTLKHAVIIAGIAVVALLTMAGVVVAIVRSYATAPSVADDRAISEQTNPDAPRVEYFPSPTPDEQAAKAKNTSRSKEAARPAAPPMGDAPALVHQLGTCLEEINVDASAAISRFGDVLGRLAECWDQLAPDQLLAAQDRIVEFVYRAGSDASRAGEVVDALNTTTDSTFNAKSINKRAFSAGMFARLSRESDLPGVIAREVSTQVAAAGLSDGATFGLGARGAVVRISGEMVKAIAIAGPTATGDDPWAAWLRLVDVVSGADEAIRDRLIAGAVESILIDFPEPLNPAAESVAKRLIAKLSWREDSPARHRVIGWFGDPRITPEDLSLITGVIAESSAPGVDRTMVLARDADPAQRDRLREVYEAAWGAGEAKPKDELIAAWITVAKQYADSTDSTATPAESMARAVILSRLSEAAARIWVGEDVEPAEIVKAPEATVVNLLTSPGANAGALSGDAGGEWAERYISAKAQPSERLRLLGELATRDSIGAADAEVLIVEAIRGNSSSIRRAADTAVRRLAKTPQIVNAMLEQAYLLPKASEVIDLAELISGTSLPPTRDASWRAAVRRSLVERLLQLLASEGDDGAIDALTERLALTYAGRQVAATTDRLPPDATAGAPIDALRKSLSAWDRLARSLTASGREPLRLDQIERRAVARAKNANGIVQKFAADQVTLAETMVYSIACERPARSGEITRVLEELSTRRRMAEHVMTQLRDGERAMLELWIIRLEGGR